MRLLLDECVPAPLKGELPGHDVSTAHDMGWSAKDNGELLALMLANGFDCLVTVDQNLPFQQTVSAAGVAVAVLVAPTNRLKELRPLVPALREALEAIGPGDLVKVR